MDDRTAELSAAQDVAPVPQAYRPPAQRGPSEAPTIPDSASAGWNTRAAADAWNPTRAAEAPPAAGWSSGPAAPAAPADAPGPDSQAPVRYDADAPIPEAPPSYPGQHRAPRPKYFALRIAAVLVLVLGAAVGVAFTVIGDSDPDTVQVADDLPPDNQALAPTAGPDAAPSPTQPDPAEQQQAIDNAQNRAEEKAADAQADAAALADDAEEAREKRAKETGTTGAPVPTAPVDCETLSGNKNTGCALLSEFGFPTSEMTCLEQLWTKESGWNEKAENTGSGAYGIPQALPGDKMASVADDWRTNPATQIRWGLGYIKGKYDTPCGAWNYFQNNGHY
ncbi:hypothetical protein CryarDRAFT_4222 [Cryptosporangium arvum DSM 44712]|uniref:Transglycosylase family protein n=1 Tax=Cryptosporangium arvum DSM 44712 TaxID=927661 RepID=A0A010YS22_9ACTN|nr:hypothetical protein CryarDRAFT_4222 [Cryptosporangium arvum DSM 44712]